MQRYALFDEQWEQIKDEFPENGQPGGQWKDHRLMVDGCLWILHNGGPWRDLPKRFGPWQTVYDRFRLWSRDGTWDRILDRLKARKDQDGEIDWELFCIDGSVVRAHKAAAGARKKGVPRMSPLTTP